MRTDQKAIAELILPDTKVMDIGCCEGDLLAYLEKVKNIKGYGLEIESDRAAKAVEKGLSVVQGDADTDLQYYTTGGFDYAILGQTMQVMRHPKQVLEEALRVATRVIVVIPNFGYIGNRLYFISRGRMPVTKELSYQWYETPNIHFCTIKDMVFLAEEINALIEKRFFITKNGDVKKFAKKGTLHANLFGKYGIFILRKK